MTIDKVALEDLASQARYLKVVVDVIRIDEFSLLHCSSLFDTEWYDVKTQRLTLLIDLYGWKIVGWKEQQPCVFRVKSCDGLRFFLLNDEHRTICSLKWKVPFRLLPSFEQTDDVVLRLLIQEDGTLQHAPKAIDLSDFVESGELPPKEADRVQEALQHLLSLGLSANELRAVVNGIVKHLAFTDL